MPAKRKLIEVALPFEAIHRESAREKSIRHGHPSTRQSFECHGWVAARGLSEGDYMFELVDEQGGTPLAILDLAWPRGLQEELSVPVALLLNEPAEVLEVAQSQGCRCFTSIGAFKRYVEREVLRAEPQAEAA